MRNSTWKQGPHENIDFRDSYFSETHCILIKQANHKRKEKVPSLFFQEHFSIVTSRWSKYSTRCGFQ